MTSCRSTSIGTTCSQNAYARDAAAEQQRERRPHRKVPRPLGGDARDPGLRRSFEAGDGVDRHRSPGVALVRDDPRGARRLIRLHGLSMTAEVVIALDPVLDHDLPVPIGLERPRPDRHEFGPRPRRKVGRETGKLVDRIGRVARQIHQHESLPDGMSNPRKTNLREVETIREWAADQRAIGAIRPPMVRAHEGGPRGRPVLDEQRTAVLTNIAEHVQATVLGARARRSGDRPALPRTGRPDSTPDRHDKQGSNSRGGRVRPRSRTRPDRSSAGAATYVSRSINSPARRVASPPLLGGRGRIRRRARRPEPGRGRPVW